MEFDEDPIPDEPETVLEVVGRDEWGAVPPSGELEAMDMQWPYVLWTYTNTEPCYTKEDCSQTLQQLQKKHMEERGMADIQYNFYIGGDLNIYEGRGWKKYHSCLYPGYSDGERMSVGLAYIGKYENQNYPNQDVLELRKTIVKYGIEKELIDYEYSNLLLTTNLNQ